MNSESSEVLSLSIGVPEAVIPRTKTVYVHHVPDEHDPFGSSYLAQVKTDNTVSVDVNHFSIFTVTPAQKAEIKYVKGEESGLAQDIQSNDARVAAGQITFAVPDGITVSVNDSNGTQKEAIKFENGKAVYKLLAGKYTVTATSASESQRPLILTPTTYSFTVESSSVTSPHPGSQGISTSIGGGVLKPSTGGQMMYRLYNRNNGEHFFTANKEEHDHLVSIGWQSEGSAWNLPAASSTPVFRLYNQNSGEHFYTVNAEEKDALVKAGWKDEGVGWYSDEKQEVAVYRLFNPNARDAGSHHYTTSAEERSYLAGIGWRQEDVGWYGAK